VDDVIQIDGLSKTFVGKDGNHVVALEDVDLTVDDNEFVTILGPSGCGKTTLLRCIAGLVDWDDGDISIDGTPVRGPGPERAMVFQSFALLPWATVLRNVTFGLELRGVDRAEREDTANELIQLVGLSGFEQSLPGTLSGGMQQRVGLARALAVNPSVLLMDEPFGALDEQTRRLLQEELLRIWEARRITVVFITHSIEEAVLLGDRVAVMTPRPGRIEEVTEVPLGRPRAGPAEYAANSRTIADLTASLWERLRQHQPDGRPAQEATP
jgi:NitT/TauT family transport system ATP-binding protein